jgi:hypothetical protein
MPEPKTHSSVLPAYRVLEKHFNRGFSHQYVSKIADKVAREALIVADRRQIEERMDFTRENYRMMREELLKIVYWKDGHYRCECNVGDVPKAAMLIASPLRV